MENLGDLAGLDMVLLREAQLDREADPLSGEPVKRSGWVDAVVKRTACLFGRAVSTANPAPHHTDRSPRSSPPPEFSATPPFPPSGHARRSLRSRKGLIEFKS